MSSKQSSPSSAAAASSSPTEAASAQPTAAAAAAISEECLMKTRLLIDGDGTGDDRRLAQILKGIVKFSAASPDASEEDVRRAHDKLVAQLDTAEWVDAKNKLVQAMNQVELNNYEALYVEIEDGIVRSREDIQKAKVELVEARKVRRNKMEYDALAKVICVNPDRETIGRKLSEIQSELDQLRRTEENLDEKLELRKKQFHVMVHSIHQLQELLEMDREEEEVVVGGRNGEGGEGDDSEGDEDRGGGRGGRSSKNPLNTSNVSSAHDGDNNGVMEVS